MDHTDVESSHIKSVGYDRDSRVMEIAFHSGKTYSYEGVPEVIHKGLMSSKSKGRYHHLYVKKYQGSRL